MMTRRLRIISAILVALLALGGAAAQESETTVPYVRARGFNAPVLEGWANQSTDEIAQFHFAEAQATIRATLVAADDPLAAAQAELAEWLSAEIGPPVFSDKVNLADGTWQVFIFDIDAATTASVMARRQEAQVIVISFVETSPEARTVMLTLAQTDDSLDAATPEIARALTELADFNISQLQAVGTVALPSGDWHVHERPGLSAMGMIFGNDSYIALQEGALADLAPLADAWNRTLLGFFITPDNSGYLALGLAAVFIILGLLILSYFWRARSMRQDLALLNALAEEDD